MQLDDLKNVVVAALEDLKALDIKVLDVREIASFTDKVVEKCKRAGVRPLGVEGERDADWILVDLGDIIVHIMKPETRDFYNLEKLWSVQEIAGNSSAAGQV